MVVDMSGWICVHRKLVDHAIFKNDKLFRVFMFCLLKATHKDFDQFVGDSLVAVKKGSFVSGRDAISSATGLTQQNVRTALNKLKKMEILTIKSTNKYSIISIVNWNEYQQTNQQVTSSQPASNQQVTTNNNTNNNNNTNKESRRKVKTLLPDDFSVNQKMLDWFNAKGFIVDAHKATEKWINAMQARDQKQVDWVAAWRNGMIKANEWALEKVPVANQPQQQLISGNPYEN